MEKKNVEIYLKKGNPEDKENISQSLKRLENLGYFDDPYLKEIISEWLKKIVKENNKEDLEEASRIITALKGDLSKQKIILKDLEYKRKQKDFKSSETKQKTEQEIDLLKKRIRDLEKVIEEVRNSVLQETRIN